MFRCGVKGKGGFACEMARRNPTVSYFAMERVTDCAMLAAEKAKKSGDLNNLRFVIETADRLTEIFSCGSVDAIYLNFSDPWSKKGYAKRRLTHRSFLEIYRGLLKEDGIIKLKTDNVGLFDFSLEEIEALSQEERDALLIPTENLFAMS